MMNEYLSYKNIKLKCFVKFKVCLTSATFSVVTIGFPSFEKIYLCKINVMFKYIRIRGKATPT